MKIKATNIFTRLLYKDFVISLKSLLFCRLMTVGILLCFTVAAQAIEIHASHEYRIINTELLESDTLDINVAITAQGWCKRPTHQINSDHSQLWLKLQTVHQKEDLNGLYISMLGSFELYLEQRLIYRSGTAAGKGQQEVPGNMDSYIILPTEAQKQGVNTWYLRISRDALPRAYRHVPFDFTLNHYDKIITQRYQQSLIPLVSLSAFFTIAAFYFCLWITQEKQRKQTSHLVFSLLCLVIASWLLAENWRPLFGVPYHMQGLRLWFITICAGNFAMLLPGVLLHEFRILTLTKRRVVLAVLAQLMLFISLHLSLQKFDMITGLFVGQAFFLSQLVMVRALWLKRLGSFWTLTALVICIVAIFPDPYDYLEQWFFVLFPLVIVALLYRQSINIKQLQDSRDNAMLKAENLKLQLLKRSIQPHFLLNTLTSLTEWIEQSPDIAVDMVEKLADEFYALNSMVDKMQVSLAEEIQLCATHLRLMSLRNNCDFEFVTTIPQPDFQLPPGVLHTLVENAFSHNQFTSGKYRFELTQKVHNGATELVLNCPSGSESAKCKSTGGLGKTYVENRLQQAYGNAWQLLETSTESQWQTRIKINP